MSLRPNSVRRPGSGDPLAVLRAVEPVIVRDVDSLGAPSIREIRDRITRLVEVEEARSWASGDPARAQAVSVAVAALTAASYRISTDVVERANIPF